MKTKFENKEDLHNAVQSIYGTKIVKFRESFKVPVVYDLVDTSPMVNELTCTTVVVPNVMIPTVENLHQDTTNDMQFETQDDTLGTTNIMPDNSTNIDPMSIDKIPMVTPHKDTGELDGALSRTDDNESEPLLW